MPADTILLLPPQVDPAAHDAGATELSFGGAIFGTNWMVRLYAQEPRTSLSWRDWRAELQARCEAELARIDWQMSPWIADSDLCRYNALAPGETMALPEPMRSVVDHAFDLAMVTDGAFDPFLGAVTDLWGFGPVAVAEGLPREVELARLRQLRRGERPDWNGERLTRRKGFSLDLCGIAKGYAVDALLNMMRVTPGVQAVLVEIGGEAKGHGVKPDAMPWWVELEWPGALAGARILVALHGWACASSGSDVRFFEHDGRRYSHSMDPETAEASESDLRGVSVLDRQCWRADALATALFVMGCRKALAYADRHDIPCLLLPAGTDGEPVFSAALKRWAADV